MPVKIVDPSVEPKNKGLHWDRSLTDRVLTKLEFETYQRECKTRIRHKALGALDEKIDNRYFPWSDLMDAADAVEPTPGVEGRGIMIQYAIVDDDLRYGLTIFPWTEITNMGRRHHYAPIGRPDFVIDGKRLKKGSDFPWDVWQAHYYADIKMDHGTGPMVLDETLDPRGAVMRFEEEVLQLFIDNELELRGVEDPHVRITSVSTVHPGPGETGHDGGRKGYRHGIALNMAKKLDGVWKNIIEDGDSLSLYHLRAADYGNLCPVRCSYFEERH